MSLCERSAAGRKVQGKKRELASQAVCLCEVLEFCYSMRRCGSAPARLDMAEVLQDVGQASGVQRHARWVRISHWIATVSLFTLAFSGVVILMAHPRLYWGEVGNDLTPALVELPI